MVYFVNCVVFARRVFLLLVLHPIRTGFLTNTRQWTSLMWYRPGARLLGLAFRKSELAAGKTLASWGLALLSCPAAKSGAKAASTWCYCCTACSQPVAVAAARPWSLPFKFI